MITGIHYKGRPIEELGVEEVGRALKDLEAYIASQLIEEHRRRAQVRARQVRAVLKAIVLRGRA